MATKDDCDICRGVGKITLPIRSHVKVVPSGEPVLPSLMSWDYPCPECSDKVPIERVMSVLELEKIVVGSVDLLDAAEAGLLRAIGPFLAEKGLVEFEQYEHSDNPFRVVLRANVNVVPPQWMKTFNQRVRAAATEKVRQVVNAVAKQVYCWGRDTGTSYIPKDVAVDCLVSAIKDEQCQGQS